MVGSGGGGGGRGESEVVFTMFEIERLSKHIITQMAGPKN